MLTRHERKERLGFGHLARIAERTERNTGKRYSISRISQVINCEKTGARNTDIESAVVEELNVKEFRPACGGFLTLVEVFPAIDPAPASEVATTPAP